MNSTCPAVWDFATPQCSSPTVCNVLEHSDRERGTHPHWFHSTEYISWREKSHGMNDVDTTLCHVCQQI